jgi:hypothetical protein
VSKKQKEKPRLKTSYKLGEITLPKPEKYIGKFIKAEIDGKKLSNPSYVKYYKDIV